MKYIKTTWIVICLCLTTNLSAAGIQKMIEKSFDVGNGGTLRLDSDLGSVDISSHSDNKVIINVVLTASTSNEHRANSIFDDFQVTIENSGSDVRIEGDMVDHRLWWNNRLKVRFNVTVPEDYNLDIDTSGGEINVADIRGRVILKTSGGNITLGQTDGEVNARTSGGMISLKGSTGDVVLRTSGGGIHIGKVGGDVAASTSGGSIDVDMVQGNLKASTSGGGLRFRNVNGNLIGRTSGGSIEAELSAQVSEPVELYTTGGSIRLEIPADFRATLAASTTGGRVYTDLPVMIQGKISNTSLNGKINGGGPEVSLKTTGGNIDIVNNVH